MPKEWRKLEMPVAYIDAMYDPAQQKVRTHDDVNK